mgnify:FL=1
MFWTSSAERGDTLEASHTGLDTVTDQDEAGSVPTSRNESSLFSGALAFPCVHEEIVPEFVGVVLVSTGTTRDVQETSTHVRERSIYFIAILYNLQH